MLFFILVEVEFNFALKDYLIKDGWDVPTIFDYFEYFFKAWNVDEFLYAFHISLDDGINGVGFHLRVQDDASRFLCIHPVTLCQYIGDQAAWQRMLS